MVNLSSTCKVAQRGNLAAGALGVGDGPAPLADWAEADRYSFEDSDRFEEDSLCSWSSEPESLCNNWRGWKRPAIGQPTLGLFAASKRTAEDAQASVSLSELAARTVAAHIPFELVEHVYPPVPEQLQLRIAFWSFPDNEEDIRLYSCLANGSSDEFLRGDALFKSKTVKDPLQIGFHLSASVVPSTNGNPLNTKYKVAVTFDRRRITSCNCTCSSTAYWCSHVVAVCLHRIHMPNQVCLRAPVSESLSRLHREQLQKFAQYLISELPQQILPTAQRLLDELLSSQPSAINSVCGAPDPTAGASIFDQTSWYLDEKTLHDNIKKILIKFCVPAPIVFSDVNYLSTTAPPAAAEWSSLLRPLRGREPEGMWNLLSIVREMFKRNDRNAIPLLEIITKECMACDQILVWWFNTKVALHNGSSGHGGGKHGSVNSNSQASQHACSSLCDEIVLLWRLAALNPGLGPEERIILRSQFRDWHSSIIQKVTKLRGMNNGLGGVQYSSSNNNHNSSLHHSNNLPNPKGNGLRSEIDVFPGFRPALEASYLDWDEYPIPSITYQGGASRFYHCPFTCFRHGDDSGRPEDVVNQVNSSQAVLYCQHPNSHQLHHIHHHNPHLQHTHCASSSQKQRVPMASPINVFSSFVSTPLNILCQMSSRSFDLGETSRSNRPADGNRSSVSSEGFCENETDGDLIPDGGEAVIMGRVEPPGAASDSSTSSSNGGINSSSSSSSSCGRAHGAGGARPKELAVAGPSMISWSKGQTDSVKCFNDGNSSGNSLAQASRGDKDSEHNSKRDSAVFGLDEDLECFDLHSPPLNDQRKHSADCPSRSQTKDCQVLANSSPRVSDPAAAFSRSAGGDKSGDAATGPRRPSKDDSISSSISDSPHNSGDELNCYNPKFTSSSCNGGEKAISPSSCDKKDDKTGARAHGVDVIFDSLKKMTDPWDILFARAEGLHAHGHGREACLLGVQLAEEMLAHPPALMIDVPPLISKGKRKKQVNPASHQLSCLATATLSKCAFLCTVLAENRDHFHLAFKVGMFGLEMARPPASTKPLEVKLANQETELVGLLKRIPLGQAELSIIREQAELLRDGALKCRGEALLPIVLASFIFDALVLPNTVGREIRHQLFNSPLRCPSDETLGFEAAVAAMGLKANVSEADHPLLCEGTRRQRGDLAIALLCHYKDDPGKLARIMDKLLDKDVHQLLKTPLVSSYYSSNPPTRSFTRHRNEDNRHGDIGAMPSASGSPLEQSSIEGALCGPGSRPHSSTSAELDQGLGSLSLGSPQTPTTLAGTTSGRPKESSRYKGKRTYPSIPNQPSESGAHFMFELAKTVLTKAGGNSSTSLFTQPNTSNSLHGPHRALHMCAFQIGLYALGLHNCVSPNWLSRTYSSHVSWITGQAMEIGAPAISFLIDTWEGHLTPPEAASIADRASRGCDPHMVSAAAELALSCLPHSHALNPSEIHRAILQCKEQSDEMLEHSCLTVESAAKGGGVYPEVLFQVAKYWFELFMKHSGSDSGIETDGFHEPVFAMDSGQSMLLIDASGGGPTSGPTNGLGGLPNGNCPQPMVVTTGPPQSLQPLMSVPFNMAPYSFALQNIHPMQGTFNVNQRTVTMPPPTPFQMYLSPPTYQSHTPSPQTSYNNMPSQRTVQYFGTAVTLTPTQSMNLRQGPSQSQMQQQHQIFDIRGGQGSPQQAPQSVPLQVQLQVSSSAQQQQLPTSQQIQPVQVQQLQSLQSLQTMQVQPVQQMAMQQSMQQPVQQMPMQPPVQQMSMQAIQQQLQSLQSMQQGLQQPMQQPMQQGLQQSLQQTLQQVLQQGLPQGLQALSAQQVGQVQPHQSQSSAGQKVCDDQVQMAQLLQQLAASAQSADLQMIVQADGQIAKDIEMGQAEQVVQVVQASGPIMVAVPLGAVSSAQAQALLAGSPSVSVCASLSATLAARPQQVAHRQQQAYSQTQLRYLLAAYRVGMLALETLARRVHDDRPQAKYARNPPYGEDVKWLLRVAKKLGNQYLHQFCVCAVSSIVSPFVLHDVALEAAQYLARHNPNMLMQQLRSALTPLVQKCQQMYIQCLHQKLYHLTTAEYEDFVNIVCSARAAFQITPDGAQQFKEWLQSIKRSKSCKKDLWAQINAALQANNK